MIMKDPVRERQQAMRRRKAHARREQSYRKKGQDTTKLVMILAVAIFLVIIILFYAVNKNKDLNYNDIKENKSKDLVYTRYTKNTNNYSVEVPYVNMNIGVVAGVNEDIVLFVNDFMDSNKAYIGYKYNISGHILSLIIQIVDYDTDTVPETYFRSYNINLTNGDLLSEQAILDYYGVTTSQVESIIESQFQDYYNEEVAEGYFSKEECNMSCFLTYRDMNGYMENINYFINNGKLYVYKPFQVYSIFGEEEYFKDTDFEFLIAHQPVITD